MCIFWLIIYNNFSLKNYFNFQIAEKRVGGNSIFVPGRSEDVCQQGCCLRSFSITII